uniref:Histone-lysine N-methyltransferase, H3 lysine-79 specific n=1 Tax=Aceria tosichella TaxID=561515 RepID=A0A6G1S693_9ACAR
MSNTKPDIVLNSPVGGKPAIYKWPLSYVSKGQKIDGAEEIIETMRWVAKEFVEFKPAIENILPNQPDPKSYEFIKGLCDRYNKILEMVTKMNKGTSVAPKTSSRASPGLLKHIIQQVYNYAVADPTELNKYSPFSSETYGETSFEFMAQLIEKNQFRPKENDTFIDLGSGVGHLVLQMAASVDCKKCYGIEISDVPAGYAKVMEDRFKFWMNWHGKIYTEFELLHGDFFANKYVDIIKNATYILVNNYAFKPEVDHKLKQRFLDLKDGVQILSSKPFCSPKARVTERHLTDIGSIMRVVEIHPELRNDTVSWTPKPLPYYLHILDASPVEKYYERKKRRQGRSVDRGRPGKRRKTGKGSGSDADSDYNDHVVGATTRAAWSKLWNSTNASNRASADSVKSSRNNSTDTENYESAIENEESTNATAEATSAAPTKSTKENETPTKREKKIQDTQGAATEKLSSPAQGTSAQTKASQSASQAAKSCLDKKRDYASKKDGPNTSQNEKSYSCLTKTSDSSNGSSPSKVPPLVIKVTPPVESKAVEEQLPKSAAHSRNETQKSNTKVNDENGKQLRQRKRPTPAQSTNDKAQPSSPAKETGKQGSKGSQASGQNSAPSASVTRGSKRALQAAAKSTVKASPAAKRGSDNKSSLDLLHTKTIESVSSNAGYFPQPAPGCEDYNLRSIMETPSLPKVTIKDVGMYSDYVKRSEDRCLELIRGELDKFLKKTLQPGCREILTEQIRLEQMKKAMLIREMNDLQRYIKLLSDRIPKVMKPHCDQLSIKNNPRSIVSQIGVQLKRHQELTTIIGQIEASMQANQRTMNPPAAHSNSNQCLSSPYRSSSSSATLDLSLK